MNRRLLLFVLLPIISACGNNNADEPATRNDTISTSSEYFLWESNFNDSTGKLVMTRSKPAGIDSLVPGQIIAQLNSNYPNVQLSLHHLSNDTLYVDIPEANYLTQQMGSSGPMMYFAAVVYNLTEIPGVRYVNFDFDEGDHAGPAVYSRTSFKDE